MTEVQAQYFIDKLINIDDLIVVSQLSDEQLMTYYNICGDGELRAKKELINRKIL